MLIKVQFQKSKQWVFKVPNDNFSKIVMKTILLMTNKIWIIDDRLIMKPWASVSRQAEWVVQCLDNVLNKGPSPRVTAVSVFYEEFVHWWTKCFKYKVCYRMITAFIYSSCLHLWSMNKGHPVLEKSNPMTHFHRDMSIRIGVTQNGAHIIHYTGYFELKVEYPINVIASPYIP